MKFVLVVSLAFLVSACQSDVSELSDADRKLIEASSTEWVKTYNRNDWQALSELFTSDAVMMPPNSAAAIGRSEIAAWQAKNESGFRIAFDIQQIDGTGDLAFVRGRSCVFIPIGNEAFGVDVGKFLEIRKKQPNGKWLIQTDIFNSDAAIGSNLAENCPFTNVEKALLLN